MRSIHIFLIFLVSGCSSAQMIYDSKALGGNNKENSRWGIVRWEPGDEDDAKKKAKIFCGPDTYEVNAVKSGETQSSFFYEGSGGMSSETYLTAKVTCKEGVKIEKFEHTFIKETLDFPSKVRKYNAELTIKKVCKKLTPKIIEEKQIGDDMQITYDCE